MSPPLSPPLDFVSGRETKVWVAIFIFMLVIGTGCKKKDRNSSSNLVFRITPPAATVVKGDSLPLRAEGVSPSGTVSVSPAWTVSSSAGVLNTDIGPLVTLDAQTLGDVVVTATFRDHIATSQIAIVTFIPSSNTFDVYTDAGLPTGTDVDLFVVPGFSGTIGEISAGYTPEGVKYQRSSNCDDPDSWGITFDATMPNGETMDLSSFAGGTLKFSIRLVNKTLLVGENIEISISDTPGVAGFAVTLAGGHGFNKLSTDWQEISISISSFVGENLSSIVVPFAVELASITSPLTFDIDAVRWEK